MQTNALLTTAVVYLLAGCVTAPAPSAQLQSQLAPTDIALQILQAAEKCWERPSNIPGKGLGIHVRNQIGVAGPEISVSQINQLGREQNIFLTLRFMNDGTGTSITANEGGFMNSKRLNLTSDVTRWLSGDRSCCELPY